MNEDNEHRREPMVVALARLQVITAFPDRPEPNRGGAAAPPERHDEKSEE
jgi:hypothetical protein